MTRATRCPKTTKRNLPCRNGVAAGRSDCGSHTDASPVHAVSAGTLHAAPAVVAATDPFATPAPVKTGRFGHFGPHLAVGNDEASDLLRRTSHVVTRHDEPCGGSGETLIDADVYDPASEDPIPVLSVTIAYDGDGSEVRAWRSEDTYATQEALDQLMALAGPASATDQAA